MPTSSSGCGVEAFLAQRLEQPVAVGDAGGLDADGARHLVSSRRLFGSEIYRIGRNDKRATRYSSGGRT